MKTSPNQFDLFEPEPGPERRPAAKPTLSGPSETIVFDREHPHGKPAPRNPDAYICHEVNGVAIEQRRSDGYCNATAMCRAHQRQYSTYARAKATKEFLAALSAKANMQICTLVQSEVGGRHSGTWVHPLVSYNLAQWCSADFAVTVSLWIDEWSKGNLRPVDAATEVRMQEASDQSVELVNLLQQNADLARRADANAQQAAVKADEARQITTETQLDLWRTTHEFDARLRKLEMGKGER
jgi:hypothetical protein